MTRTGDEYPKGLDDGLYDMQHDPAYIDTLTYATDESGRRAHRAFQIPRSYEDLIARRKAMKLWSETSFGYLGRTPDYKAARLVAA